MIKSFHYGLLVLVVCLGYLGAPQLVSAQVSDDFSSLELDPAVWSLVDPVGNVSHDLLNGLLTLHLPPFADHDPRVRPNGAVRLMQPVTDVDFEIEAKFQSIPAEDYQAQGLLAESESSLSVSLATHHTGTDLKVSWAATAGGVTIVGGEMGINASDALWLRLGRTGSTWQGYYSQDGETWLEAFDFDFVMTLAAVGVFGGNAGTGYQDVDRERDNPVGDKRGGGRAAPAFDVVVDYFFDTAAPIIPEDGNLVNGVRVVDDLQALYFFRAGEGDVVFDYGPTLPKLDLTISDPGTATWLPGGGLDLTAPTLITSAGPAAKIIDACTASDEITLEAWVDPVTTDQEGPARILTLSGDPSNRNATLAHGQYESLPNTVFGVRLRTTETSNNGQPETISPAGTLNGDLQHVVYTRDPEGQAHIYIDGVRTVTENIDGTLDNWDSSYGMAIGAEMDGTRFWLGKIHLAAIYSRALTPGDIEINFGVGPTGGAQQTSPPAVSLSGMWPGQSFTFLDQVDLNAVASDLDGEVTQVEFFAGDVRLASVTVEPFAFTWTDPAVGTHQMRAVATDDQGNQSSSAVVPILVTVPLSFQSAQFVSDDFHDEDLGLPWIVADGSGGAVIHQDAGNAFVYLPVSTQDPWTPGAQLVFAHQAETDVDLALELKLAANDFEGSTFGGLRFEGVGGEVVQLLGERRDGSWIVSWGTADGGVFANRGFESLAVVAEGVWLQVRRQSGAWVCLFSTDGYNWQQAAYLTRPMTLDLCGWVAGGLEASAGAQTAAFDYAFNLASPIYPEDGGNGGDYTGAIISDLAVAPFLDHAELSWQTDEPASSRMAYGLTSEYELGVWQGSVFLTDHTVELTGLPSGKLIHFQITCVDAAGNFSTSGDQTFHTDLEAVLAAGPGSGDVFREERRAIYAGETWRVTDPDATADGAAEFLPNPVLDLEVPDLTGAVRAEMIIDRWGGHPGTSNKWIRLGGASWIYLPELASIPASNPECYMYEDNLMIDIPLDQLQAGTITLEGTADRQICYNFNWGQWGWFGVMIRVYYDGSVAHPTGSILSPVAGETIIDAVVISVDAAAAGTVEEVHVLAYYEGHDTDGDGVFTDWHREYFRTRSDRTISLGGTVGKVTEVPYEVNWDVAWIPDQLPGSVKLQARILDDDGMWYVTDFVENLSLEHSDGVVKMYSMDSLPTAFVVRNGQSKTAEFTIPQGDDLNGALEARMLLATWNGSDTGRIDINGAWNASGFGVSHFYSLDEFILPVSALDQGVNEVTISATTIHHGMEVLWPGPMFFVRYGPGAAAPPTLAVAGDVDATVPDRFALGDNYPNPFNPITRISFDLPVSSRVRLQVHDVRGREISTLVSAVMPAGTHTALWDGTDQRGARVPSGVYFYLIEAEGFSATGKMLLLK